VVTWAGGLYVMTTQTICPGDVASVFLTLMVSLKRKKNNKNESLRNIIKESFGKLCL
jgi:hypothetical protein